MARKSKGVVILDSKLPYGVGVFEDAKSREKHQSLMQDYHELQREADVMKSKLEAAKLRKLTLTAEVRFLRRKHKFLTEIKTINVPEEQRHVLPPKSLKQTKFLKEQRLSITEASQPKLPLLPEPNPKKRRNIVKQVPPLSTTPVIHQKHKKISYSAKETGPHTLTPTSVLNQKGRTDIRKRNYSRNTPVLDLNQTERMCVVNDTDRTLRKLTVAFDLNQESGSSRKEVYLPIRAPIFDLNEISTGDEDFPNNVEGMKLEETRKSLIRDLNDDQQYNDSLASICRNSGEGSSRVGKRKISWQDPVVALRV